LNEAGAAMTAGAMAKGMLLFGTWSGLENSIRQTMEGRSDVNETAEAFVAGSVVGGAFALAGRVASGIRRSAAARFEAEGESTAGRLENAGDDVVEGAGNKTGKFIDNTKDKISKDEKRVVDDLVGQGKTVERIPRDPQSIDKSSDFKIDGVITELKTLENANTNTGMKRIQKGFSQGAETVIIDARGSGLTSSQAGEMINRVKGKYPNGQIPGKVEIWIDGQVITYP
jgi:hypothetical protein